MHVKKNYLRAESFNCTRSSLDLNWYIGICAKTKEELKRTRIDPLIRKPILNKRFVDCNL
jgi:hypothetical protein